MNFSDYFKEVNKLYEGLINQEDLKLLADLDERRVHRFGHLLSGTTIMGIKAKDAVIMAGDTRVSSEGAGGGIVSDRFDKILKLDSRTLIAVAGVMGWAIKLVRSFRGEVRVWFDITGRELSTKGKVRRLAELTGQFLAPAIQLGMLVVPILGTFDKDEGPRVFQIWPDQSYIEKDWTTEGSGGIDARGVLTANYHKDLTKEQAIELARLALGSATTDLHTGPTRTIKIIDKNGISVIEEV